MGEEWQRLRNMVAEVGLKDLEKTPAWKDEKKAPPLFRKQRKRNVIASRVTVAAKIPKLEKSDDNKTKEDKMIDP